MILCGEDRQDSQGLNSITVKKLYPLRLISTAFKLLHSASFNKFDLCSSYYLPFYIIAENSLQMDPKKVSSLSHDLYTVCLKKTSVVVSGVCKLLSAVHPKSQLRGSTLDHSKLFKVYFCWSPAADKAIGTLKAHFSPNPAVLRC